MNTLQVEIGWESCVNLVSCKRTSGSYHDVFTIGIALSGHISQQDNAEDLNIALT